MKFLILKSFADFSSAERIESLKAGILAGLSLTVVGLAIAVFHSMLLLPDWLSFLRLQVTTGVNLILRIAIAFVSGFLFGVTYRYIIRTDDNSHLNDGAVLAFALVRALAVVEGEQNLSDACWLFAVGGIESIIGFAIARFILDLAIRHHWLKPFPSSN